MEVNDLYYDPWMTEYKTQFSYAVPKDNSFPFPERYAQTMAGQTQRGPHVHPSSKIPPLPHDGMCWQNVSRVNNFFSSAALSHHHAVHDDDYQFDPYVSSHQFAIIYWHLTQQTTSSDYAHTYHNQGALQNNGVQFAGEEEGRNAEGEGMTKEQASVILLLTCLF